jgi:hypothetical protein
VLALAEEHSLAPALWVALRDGPPLPAEVASRLRRAHRSNVGRELLLRRQLASVGEALGARGVDTLLLKGAAYLAADVFDAGAREMSDLDVVVRPVDLEAADEAMRAAGYSFVPHPYGLVHHDRMYLHPDGVAPVELHTAMGDPEVEATLPSLEVWARSQPVELAGTAVRVPSPEDALAHNVLHAQVQDRDFAYLGVPLRQLHTFVAAARAWSPHVDWAVVERRLVAAGHRRHWTGHAHLAVTIFGADGLPAVAADRSIRAHTSACLVSFGLAWPTDAARNLGYALDREYLEVRYGASRSRWRLATVRVRHLARVLRARGAHVVGDVSAPRR